MKQCCALSFQVNSNVLAQIKPVRNERKILCHWFAMERTRVSGEMHRPTPSHKFHFPALAYQERQLLKLQHHLRPHSENKNRDPVRQQLAFLGPSTIKHSSKSWQPSKKLWVNFYETPVESANTNSSVRLTRNPITLSGAPASDWDQQCMPVRVWPLVIFLLGNQNLSGWRETVLQWSQGLMRGVQGSKTTRVCTQQRNAKVPTAGQ